MPADFFIMKLPLKSLSLPTHNSGPELIIEVA
jgi:hypothetical protein